MAPPTLTDQEFVLLCLKQLNSNSVKPDFSIVAGEIGGTSQTAYHRHWRLMKNAPELGVGAWGAGSAGAAVSGTAASAPKTPTKRKSKATADAAVPKEAKKADVAADNYDGFVDDDVDVVMPSPKKTKSAAAKGGKAKGKTAPAKGKGKAKAVAAQVEEVDDAATVAGEELDQD